MDGLTDGLTDWQTLSSILLPMPCVNFMDCWMHGQSALYASMCRWIVIFGHVWAMWPCMVRCSLHGHVWPWVVIYGQIRLCMAMNGHAWSCMVICGYVWPFMARYGLLWSCMLKFIYVWSCMVMHGPYGHVWSWSGHVLSPSYTMYGKVLSFMVMYGHVWPCMIWKVM